MQMIEPELQELIADSRSNKHFKSESLKGNVSDDEENIKISTKNELWKNPDSGATFWNQIEILRQQFLNDFTDQQVKIDPLGEIKKLNRPEDVNIVNELREVIEKHKMMFNTIVGSVTNPAYLVHGKIEGKTSNSSRSSSTQARYFHNKIVTTQS